MAGVLFEDIFDVKDIDPDGKKFERGEYLCGCITVERKQFCLCFISQLYLSSSSYT